MNLSDVKNGGTFCFSKAGLAIGSTDTQIAIAAPNGAGVDFCINGIMYHKADAATVALATVTETGGTAAVQGVLTTCMYVVCLNAAGTLSTVQGNVASSGQTLKWPRIPATSCPIGAMKVALAAAATFTPGTTDHDAADVTVTYYDLFSMPTAPIGVAA